MPRTSWEKLGEFRLQVPELPTQSAIADYLDGETARIDSLIEKKRRMVELLEERYSSLVDKVTIQADGAQLVSIGRLLTKKITDGPHESPEYFDDGVPFLSIEAIENDELLFDNCRYISEDQHKEYSRKACPQKDDVLLAKTGATIGKTVIVRTNRVFNIWSPLALLRPDRARLLPEFLWHSLRSRYLQDQIKVGATQSTQPNIAMGDIAALRLHLPSLDEQQRIVTRLSSDSDRVLRLIKALNTQSFLLAEHRQALITAAVTGELPIPGIAA